MKYSAALLMETPVKEIVDTGKKAEERGYSIIWIPDERFNKNPYVILSALATNTNHITLATGVTNPYTRNPVFTAAAIASVDDLSNGRALLGLGAGSPMVTRPLSILQENPISTVREAVTVIRKLLKGETVTVHRKEFNLLNVKLDFEPKNVVPIYIAGRGPKILELGGEIGDGIIEGAGLASTKGMEYAFSHIRKGASKAKRDIENLDVVCWAFLSISDDEEQARDVLRPLISRIVNAVPLVTLIEIGVEKEQAAKIKKLFELKGPFADEHANLRKYVGTDLIDQFSIAGSPEYCLERVEELIERGVTHIGVLPFANPSLDHKGVIATFAQKVVKDL